MIYFCDFSVLALMIDAWDRWIALDRIGVEALIPTGHWVR